MSPTQPSEFGQALNDVVEKTQLLVREEIELAKAEVAEKVNKLVKGAIVGIVAGVFFLVGLVFLLHGGAWLLFNVIPIGDGNDVQVGYFAMAILLFLLGAVAGFLAFKFVKKGAPPTPQMAIEEGRLIKETYSKTPPTPQFSSLGERN